MRETLIKTYHLESASVEKQDEMIEKIGGMIFQGVLLRIAPNMNEAQQNELERLVSTDTTPEELMGFLNKEVPNFQAIVADEAERFRQESEAIMSQVKG